MKPDNERLCPLLNKPCIQEDCLWWIKLRGKDPQTDADVDHYDCTVRWLPILTIENSGEARKVQAQIQELRSDTAVQSNALTMITHAMLEARRSGRKRPVKVLRGYHG